MNIEVENYDQEQIDELLSTDYLNLNGQIYVKKEKVFELTQKFIDKLEAEGKIKFLNAAQSEALSDHNNEQAKEICPECGTDDVFWWIKYSTYKCHNPNCLNEWQSD